jgi:hypothetical protein
MRRVVAVMDGRVRWRREITEACVLKLRAAGLVPAAISDELRLSDAYVSGYFEKHSTRD